MAAVGAFAVESANIVGYGPTTLPADGLSVGPSFTTINGSAYDLMDVRVVGYETESMGDVQVQTLTGAGGTDRTFIWYDFVQDEVAYYGWFDGDTFEPLTEGEVTLAPGEGLWSVTTADGLSLQTSGSVPSAADVALALPADGLTVANPTPVIVDLIDCYVSGYATENMGDVQVQTLTGAGGTDRTFIWYDFVQDEVAYYGWFDGDTFEPLADDEVTLAPGEGLWTVSTDTLNFVWPKVTL